MANVGALRSERAPVLLAERLVERPCGHLLPRGRSLLRGVEGSNQLRERACVVAVFAGGSGPTGATKPEQQAVGVVVAPVLEFCGGTWLGWLASVRCTFWRADHADAGRAGP